ncbi:GAF domain-containing protein [Kineococcus sp. GCM10028916]|uniref:GAF domain-containing protein n=1 Tax=Kineococcus sp. GCM10028916 TaxID=3273394 RepID=UPI00362F4D49
MTLADHFREAYVFHAGWDDADLVPTTLARTVASVLAVDAASISFFGGDHRVLLGASTPEAAAAEQWQYTLGEGPCIAAFQHSAPVVADEPSFARRWPALHQRVRRDSPYRSVVAVPLVLGSGGSGIGAIDLYSTDAQVRPGFDVDSAQAVAGMACSVLLQATLRGHTRAATVDGEDEEVELTLPAEWLDTHAASRRYRVWLAVGILNSTLQTDTPSAFALLRAHAHSRDQTLEEVAEDVVSGRTPVADLGDLPRS